MRGSIKAVVDGMLVRAKLRVIFDIEHRGVFRDLQNLERRIACRRRSERS